MTRACSLSELDDGKPFGVEIDDVEVVLVRQGDIVHALRDECSHATLSLSEGEVTRKGIECWLHGSCFDLRTGQPSSLPATEPVDVFGVEIRDGDVYVDVTTTTN
ncbi:non-heme iron oxygenase ferredoxin subunit [Actinophytocola algeriensis]|uniref:3-phenylpropionate/trans-cinnamate dioxygenase ferredoxin subunit n=1 Tax=Actinophytocola algeriensis TaxID=1768010 RepID=A0A7W7VGI0_9PSEU|nr:non-heme iron oxygenase ferredoxin subunit [Actinophytocola algeriensis]MBB4909090.1 3-phenylpropionate/trans-cinnamate dioxygenase ferredoxin subunit [Actinophytocola algeriensis]MBE1474522.1 3-phenylpropionate/trans-cinnamate dioxygenase ferredoxin subunit [Actinophytocola algeriensis]